MKKRIGSVILTLAMVLALFPAAAVPARAAGTVQIGGLVDAVTGETATLDGQNLPTGSYRLTKNVTHTSAIIIPSGAAILLDLNGFALDHGNAVGSVLSVSGVLTLIDSSAGKTGKVTGSKNTGYSGGVSVGDGGTFVLNGATISGNTAARGAGVQVSSGGTFVMESGEISGNNATSAGGGGVYVADGGTFVLNGGTITANTSIGGYTGVAVHLTGAADKRAIFTMNGGSIEDHTFSGLFSAVHMGAYSTFVMNGGEIKNTKNNSESNPGGAVRVYASSAEFVMSGGAITGNKAPHGAGVCVQSGSFTMTGGEISGNTTGSGSGGNGSGVYLDGTNTTCFIQIGGTIGSNSVLVKGPWFYSSGTYSSAAIDGGYKVDFPKDTADSGNYTELSTVPTGDLTSETHTTTSSKTYTKGIKLTENLSTDAAISVSGTVYFDLAGHTITNESGSVFTVGDGAKLYLFDSSADKTGALKGGSTDGTVRLTGSGEFYLCGGTITKADGVENSYGVCAPSGTTGAFGMYGGTISGHTGSGYGGVWLFGRVPMLLYGGTISGNTSTGSSGFAAGIFVSSGASELRMYGGTIENNTGAGYGGGISSALPVYLYGGTIRGNTAAYGGGIYMTNPTGVLRMYGGTIEKNSAPTGGGVYLASSSSFYQYGGTIGGASAASANSATNTGKPGGGGVSVASSAVFTMNGGAIAYNTSARDGGGVYIDNSNSTTNGFTMNGGTIFHNSATGSGGGGGIYKYRGAMTVNGGEISGNTSVQSGGGILLGESGALTINGGTISGNTSNGVGGGGVYNVGNNSPITMNGGSITGNTANGNGGGVCMQGTSARFTMHGGVISGNTAVQRNGSGGYGGGVSGSTSYGGTFTMTGGSVCDNTAVSGGGVYMPYGGTVSISGGTISGNKAEKGSASSGGSGGGIYASGSVEVTLSDTAEIKNNTATGGGGVYMTGTTKCLIQNSASISGNTASGAAGGVYMNSGTLTMTGGSITGNTCNSAYKGGGVWFNSGTFSISGAPVITGNKKGSKTDNVFLEASGSGDSATHRKITVNGELAADASIGVTIMNNRTGIFTSGADGNAAAANFTSDNDSYTVIESGNELALAENYTVTYDANGGSGAPSSQTKTQGIDLTLSSTAPTREGYTFTEWNTQSDGSGTAYAAGGIYAADEAATLYAQWTEGTPATYTVTVAPGIPNGTVTADKSTATAGGTVTLTATPDSGYQFSAWSVKDADNGDVAVTGNTFTMPASNVTVTATFTVVPTYTVSFETNGGRTVAAQAVASGGTIVRPADPTREGYTFAGWYGDAALTTPYDFTDPATTDLTLYAKWEAEDEPEYTVSGSVKDDEDQVVSGATVKLMQGNAVLQTDTTDADGKFSFSAVTGNYNIVAERGEQVKTQLVALTRNISELVLEMPSGSKNSVLDNDNAGNYAATVGGLDEIAADETVGVGETVTIKLVVTSEEKVSSLTAREQAGFNAGKAAIAAAPAANGKTVEFLDLKLEKVSSTDGTSDIGGSNTKLLTIIIPFVRGSKTDIVIYRSHGGTVDTITEIANTLGERIAIGVDSITLYAMRFSTYAIGYVDPETPAPTPIPTPDPIVIPYYPYYPVFPSAPVTYSPNILDSEGGSAIIDPVIPKEGDTVTITPQPTEGYDVGSVSVTGSDGKPVDVKSHGDGSYSFIQPDGKVTIAVSFTRIPITYKNCPMNADCLLNDYTDAEPNEWYHDGVHWALENGVMNGYGGAEAGKFGPNDVTSRAMMAQILWNMEGKPMVNYPLTSFDVTEGMWYTEAVRWVTAEGIMNGYGDGLFGPDDAMTREQLVTIMYRYAQCEGVDVSVGEDTNILSYDDAFDVSEWAIPAMQWAVGTGAVGGRTDTTLNPKGTATRAEIATIVMRYLTKIANYHDAVHVRSASWLSPSDGRGSARTLAGLDHAGYLHALIR